MEECGRKKKKMKATLRRFAPLTLEQVLARSLRLPKKRVNKALFSPTAQGAEGGQATSTWNRSVPNAALARSRDSASMMELMRRLEQSDEERTRDRQQMPKGPAHKNHLIRTSQDLLTLLQAAKRMRSWEDALDAFSQCREAHITPNIAHLKVVADTLAQSNKWDVLHSLLLREDAGSHADKKEVVAHLVPFLFRRSGGEGGVEGTLVFLNSLPDAILSTQAFNELLSFCTRSSNWEGCVKILANMGRGDLDLSSASRPLCQELTPLIAPDALSSDTGSSARPPPDAVSFASLVAVLQETGRKDAALDILMRLPPATREIILTSTVALIHVWSEQRSRKGPPGA